MAEGAQDNVFPDATDNTDAVVAAIQSLDADPSGPSPDRDGETWSGVLLKRAMKQNITTAPRHTNAAIAEQSDMQDEKFATYWREYRDFWDGFVQDWFMSGANPQDPVSDCFKAIVDFYENELPEPYAGDPRSKLDAVFLNMNPGMGAADGSDDCLEATKYYSNLDKPIGWLIREFRDASQGKYSSFVSKWSCLNPQLRGHTPEVCGVNWWQGNDPREIGGRMRWIRQIYDNDQMSPARVFSTEICPYHSKRFPTNRIQHPQLTKFIWKRVIIPASIAVISNQLPFAVAIGESYVALLEKDGFNTRLEKEWSAKNCLSNWPRRKKKDKPVERVYRLYKLTIEQAGDARFLVTYSRGGSKPPRDRFKSVEAQIRQYIQDHPC